MNRIAWVVIAALCWPMFAGAAYGGDVTRAFCKGFEIRLERLCAIDETSCDRLTTAFNAACGAIGTIYASPAADSLALDLLREDYDVVTVDENFPVRILAAPVVVAAPDLDDPTFTSLLNLAHRAGKTVAIVDATQDEADRFARFFGASGANCAPASGFAWIELYGLQASRARRPSSDSSYCLVGLSGLDRSGEGSARRWLRERFALSAPEPTPPEAISEGSNSGNSIVDLATPVHCSFMNGNDPAGQGRVLTQDVYVTGSRSFVNSEDIYYVRNDLQYEQGTSTNSNYGYQVTRFGATGVANFRSGLSRSHPVTTTQFRDSFVNDTNQTVSGSVGFNVLDIFAPVLGAAGTTGEKAAPVGQTIIVEVPATKILNNSVNPLPAWQFQREDTAGSTYGPETSWFWTVPWGNYADGGEGSSGRLQFTSALSMSDFVGETACSVPYPFGGILKVGEPMITSVAPKTVPQGGKFTITGAHLYPGMVNAILLGGDSVGASNFTDNGETSPGSGVFTVDVIVPGSQKIGNNSVVAQQTFNGQKRFSNVDQSVTVQHAFE